MIILAPDSLNRVAEEQNAKLSPYPTPGDLPLAIAIEFVSVIVRKAAAERKYPGGLDRLAQLDLANYLEDEHLVRIGFMSSHEALGFADELEAAGLHYSDDHESDIAVIPWMNGATPPWLSVGECDRRWACWLGGCSPGKLIDLDPCMMLRMTSPVFPSIDAVVRILRQGGVDVRASSRSIEGPATMLLECTREGAWIEVVVFMDSDGERPIGVWGRRNLARRTTIEADQALMRDLTTALVSAGAEDPSGQTSRSDIPPDMNPNSGSGHVRSHD